MSRIGTALSAAVVGVTLLALAAPSAEASFTSTMVGLSISMTGDATGEALIIDQNGGLLRHNRYFAGDPGFTSQFDWDTTTAGDQTVAATANATVYADGLEGDDTFQLGSLVAPASAVRTLLVVTGGNDTDAAIFDDSADVRIEGNMGNDSFTVGHSSTSGANQLTGFVAPLSIAGGDGIDSVTFTDNANSSGRTITVGDRSLKAGEAPISWDADVETAALSAGSGPDQITKAGGFPMAFSTNAGDDVLTTADTASDAIDCGSGIDIVHPDNFDGV